MRAAIDLIVTAGERRMLRRLARRSVGRIRRRARIVLLAALGWTNQRIAEKVGTDPHTVARWRNRFAADGLAGIECESERQGRPRSARKSIEREVVRLTRRLQRRGQVCSSRTIAARFGVNHMLVYRVWKDHGIVP